MRKRKDARQLRDLPLVSLVNVGEWSLQPPPEFLLPSKMLSVLPLHVAGSEPFLLWSQAGLQLTLNVTEQPLASSVFEPQIPK